MKITHNGKRYEASPYIYGIVKNAIDNEDLELVEETKPTECKHPPANCCDICSQGMFEWVEEKIEENWRAELREHLFCIDVEIEKLVETLIGIAEKRWAEKMKAQCLAVIPERNDVNKFSYDIDTAYNLGIKHCRQNISII